MANPFLILHLTFLLSCSLLDQRVAEIAHVTYLHRGSSLSVKQTSDVITSPDGSFSFGLYNLSSTAFTLSIWFTNAASRTIAWTANPDRPVHGNGSEVTLNKDGSLVLKDYGKVVWKVRNGSAMVDHVELRDTGNLVMVDQEGNILWQSFDHPTDTLLPGQPLTATTKLVSTNPSHQSSYYTLRFNEEYILSLFYDGPDISNPYWPNPDLTSWLNHRIPSNSIRRGELDKLGKFEASDNTRFSASDWGLEIIKRRLTLDYDGNLRLYSLNKSDGSWYISWMAFSQLCDIHGLCGGNGLCVYTPAAASCTCPPGYVVVDPDDWSKGCKEQFNITCGKGVQQMGFVRIPWTDFWSSDIEGVMSASLDTCKELCLESCSCVGFVYKVYPHPHGCYLKSRLFNGKTTPGYPGDAYVKIPESFLFQSHSQANSSDFAHGHVCNASRTNVDAASRVDEKPMRWYKYYSFLAAFFLVELCSIAVGWWFMRRKQSVRSATWAVEDEEGFRVVADHFRSFTHKELQKATNNFMDELGHGQHGSVYKGILQDNRVVAIKKLEDMTGGEAEFEREVSVIGRIYHMNLVRVMGVCSEGTHRLLVYEFVENGSLAMFLFGSKGVSLQWHQRYKIAVGVAKGLAYLHHECMDWIIHCDLKPENILLDEEFEPKISDFGFAKLLHRDESDSDMSKVRGTRGYMAPEWVSSAPVTEKVDVYSFGVVLLELVMGLRVFELPTNVSGDAESALRQLLSTIGENMKDGDGNWIDDLVDPRLNGDFVPSEVLLMLEVAALCLEQDKNQRPSMSNVVQKFLCTE